MKPFTESDARQWVDQEMEGIMRGFDEQDMPDWMRNSGHFLELWKCGCWLNAMLEESGATPEQIYSIGFCHGQRSAFALKNLSWQWAVIYANEFLNSADVKDKPGVRLADKIISETISIV